METVVWWEPCAPHTHPLTAPPIGLVQPETKPGKASIQWMDAVHRDKCFRSERGWEGQSRSGWANETCSEVYFVCVFVCVCVSVCVCGCVINILGGGHGNPLPYSSLENPMERGAWWE